VQLTEAQEVAVQALAARMAEAQAAEDEIAVREMEGYCCSSPRLTQAPVDFMT
jgi:hypothetical protein